MHKSTRSDLREWALKASTATHTTSVNDEYDDDDEEEQLYERQALIHNNDNDDEINLLRDQTHSIRNRQTTAARKRQLISNNRDNSSHDASALELNHIRTRDSEANDSDEFIYFDISPSDTLQSICLRYACAVNQVKRLNNIINDQEFYGLRRIKLPLGKLGLLEEVLKAQQNINQPQSADISPRSQKRVVNSPGSALYIPSSSNLAPKYKPFLSPSGFSSDNINDLNTDTNDVPNNKSDAAKQQHNHSHSFASMRDFENVIDKSYTQVELGAGPSGRSEHKFIRDDLHDEEGLVSVDDMYDPNFVPDNVDKVFKELDYHVGKAKEAAETYDQRAAVIADTIDINGMHMGPDFNIIRQRAERASKIPEIFYCSENFGLNFKKLLLLIFVICLLTPWFFISQATNHMHNNISDASDHHNLAHSAIAEH